MAGARALLGDHQDPLQRLVAVLLDQETADLATMRALVTGTAGSTAAPRLDRAALTGTMPRVCLQAKHDSWPGGPGTRVPQPGSAHVTAE